jgi:hypothetical protein
MTPQPIPAPIKRGRGRPPIHGETATTRVQIRVPLFAKAQWDRVGSPELFMRWLCELEKNSTAPADGA